MRCLAVKGQWRGDICTSTYHLLRVGLLRLFRTIEIWRIRSVIDGGFLMIPDPGLLLRRPLSFFPCRVERDEDEEEDDKEEQTENGIEPRERIVNFCT